MKTGNNIIDKLTTANLICFLVVVILAVITFLAISKELDIIRELVIAWISATSAVTGYLFGKKEGQAIAKPPEQ